jgi:serine/threonine protein phosphatase PrpC
MGMQVPGQSRRRALNSAKSQEFRSQSAALTHRGNVRARNQDACLALPERGLWVVADGVGGHQGGELASGLIVETLSGIGEYRSLGEFMETVESGLREVDRRVSDLAGRASGRSIIASTVVALLAFDHQVACVWAGDSRIYRLRDGTLRQLTRDHSEAEELAGLVDSMGGTPRSNVITRAVGVLSEEQPLERRVYDLRPGDAFLLCSDGLYRDVSEADMGRYLTGGDAGQACRGLMELALSRACRDNVTVVTVAFPDAEAAG